jgi:hypothetical protein
MAEDIGEIRKGKEQRLEDEHPFEGGAPGGGDEGLWVQRDPSGTKRTGEEPGHVTRTYSELP